MRCVTPGGYCTNNGKCNVGFTRMASRNVFVKFDVTKKGKVINVQVTNGVPGGPNLAKEALRLIQSMPDWIPATMKGKPVEAEYNLVIPFKIKQ